MLWLQKAQLMLIRELKNIQIQNSGQITSNIKQKFHFKAPLYWKVSLPELLYQDGITRVLKDWLLVPCEWKWSLMLGKMHHYFWDICKQQEFACSIFHIIYPSV